MLALVSLLGTVGALAASHRRSHELRLPILWTAQLIMAGAVLWFFVVRGLPGFFAAQLLVSFSFYAVTPFLTARLSGLDADGSLLSRSIVITFAAAFVGTALAGTMLTQLGALRCRGSHVYRMSWSRVRQSVIGSGDKLQREEAGRADAAAGVAGARCL